MSGIGEIGGLIGWFNGGTITNSYATGKVVGPGYLGGLVGSSGTVINSFYDSTVNSEGMNDTSYGRTTAELQDIATYTTNIQDTNARWNITEDSTISSSYLYPVLMTENGVTSWKIYKPSTIFVSYSLSDITSGYTYNGSEITLTSLWDASTIFGSNYSSWVLGADYNFVYNTNAVTGFTNAGTYSGLSVDVLKSGFSEATSGNTNGSLLIDKKAIDLSVTKTYDGNANFTSGFTLDTNDIVNGDTVNVSGTATTSSANAGNYNSFSSNMLSLDNANYTLTGGAIDTTINKADVTVTANSDTTKVYNGLAQSVSGFTASGLVNNETISVLNNVTATGTGTNAGTYTATASGTDENYNLTFVDGSLVIAKADVTVTANSDTTKVYNGLAQSVSGFTASGLVNNETISVLNNVTATGTGTNAGTYTATASGTDENYNLTFVDGSLVISPKQITVSANDLSKVFGSNDPILTYTVQDIIGDDNLEGLLERASGENAGEYAISKGTLANPNYSIAFNNGVFTIKRDTTLDSTINSIINTTAVQTPKIDIVAPKITVAPQTQPVVMGNTGSQVNVMSQPIQNQNTTMVTMGELRANQDTNTPNASNDIRVPVGDNSVIELVNGGVNLPAGVEQQFFVANNEN